MSKQRRMDASAVAMKKQAAGLQAAYEQLSSESREKGKSSSEADGNTSDKYDRNNKDIVGEKLDKLSSENKNLLKEVSDLKTEKSSLQIQYDAMQRQAQNQSNEYKRLAAAHASLRE